MGIWSVGGAGGSPGITTVVMALARTLQESQRVVAVLDLDPDGGVLPFRTGVPSEPGVFTLLDPIRDMAPLPAEAQELMRQTPEGWLLLPGFSTSHQSQEVSQHAASGLLGVLTEQYDDVVIDVGRIQPGLSAWIMTNSEHVIWVMDPRPEGVVRLAQAVTGLDLTPEHPGMVLVNRADIKDRVADLGSGLQGQLGLQVVATCPIVRNNAATSGAMQAACVQMIRVMAREIPVVSAQPEKRSWRWLQ